MPVTGKRSIAAVAVLLVAYIQFNNSVFLTAPLMSVVTRDTARIGMIAAGIVFVMITGEIDLSVGATYAMAPYLMIRMSSDWGWSLWLAAPAAILIGVGVGCFNGLITVKLRIPSLITTLGTFFLLTGITVSIAHSQPIRMPVHEPFNVVFGENRFGPLDSLFSWDGLTGFTPIIWTVAVVLALTLVLGHTVFGLHVISTGSNLLAAREIGVRTDRMKIAAFMIAGGLAAFTGIITTTVSGSAAPDAGGSLLTLYAIAAAVIGGTALTGGSGTVIGALIGAFVDLLPQQRVGALGRPGHGVQHLLGSGDHRGHDPQCSSGCCSGAEEALMVDSAAPLILEAEHLSKRFGAVTALTDVSLRLHRGEVLGLVGDNGAGKSTLIKILCGFHKPDTGTYSFDGKPIQLSSPIEARALGIQTVYQDLALVNDLSVYHNMFLGRERKKRILGIPLLDNRAMRLQTIEYLSNLGIRIPNVDNTVSMLSGGQRQSIAVARSIYSNPTVLIMDEPLAALGVREGRLVLNLVQELKKRGDISIILIAHNYAQVFEVCDRINFLSGGKIVYDTPTADTTVAQLVDLVTSGYRLNDPAPVADTATLEA